MVVFSPKVLTWSVGLFASLGSVIFGYDLGIIASILTAADFKLVMGPRYANSNQEGLVTSLFLLGGFGGSFLSAAICDKIGRRRTLQVGCLIFLLGGALQTGAQNLGMMQCGRFFAGFGTGPLIMTAPNYQSEIAHPSIRGRLITLQQFMLGIGALVASFIGYGTYTGYHGDTALDPRTWRISLGIQLLPALPLLALIMFFPESPRWLASKGRNEDALKVLAYLHAHGDTDDAFVRNQMEDIKADLALEKETGTATWKELFVVPSYFRRVALGSILQFSVQMTGVSVLQYYSTTIFRTMGFGGSMILMFQSCNSVVALIAEGLCIWYIDSFGRRWPMIWCNIACGASFVVGTALMATYPAATSTNTVAHGWFIATTWLYNFFFSFGIGPLSWAYPAEIMNNRIRGKATGITSAFSWISNFMIAQITPKAFKAVGWRYYLVFAVCSFSNALVIWLLFPEVVGRRLEEVDDIFATKSLSEWIVPLHPVARIDRFKAENELREGTFVPGHAVETEALPRHDRRSMASEETEDAKSASAGSHEANEKAE